VGALASARGLARGEWEARSGGRALSFRKNTLLRASPRDAALTPCAPLAPTCACASRSLLSILGSLFIVGVYVAFKDARTFGRKMITVLSVLDFFAAAAYGIPNAHGWVCSMQSYMISFFVVSSLAWTCCVAAYALLSVSSTLRVEQHFKHFVLFTAVTTLGYMGFAASARPGFATLWCWIPVNEPHALLARGVFFILIWSAWVYNLVVYLIIR
jgi:hypothetical protein